MQECDRTTCTVQDQDYDQGPPGCKQGCFKASCEWSKSMCAAQREMVATCPLFDATTLRSLTPLLGSKLAYLRGGSVRCESVLCR